MSLGSSGTGSKAVLCCGCLAGTATSGVVGSSAAPLILFSRLIPLDLQNYDILGSGVGFAECGIPAAFSWASSLLNPSRTNDHSDGGAARCEIPLTGRAGSL